MLLLVHCSDAAQGDLDGRGSSREPGGAAGETPSGSGSTGDDPPARPPAAPGDAGPSTPAADGGVDAKPKGPLFAYVGGYGATISAFSVDASTGALAARGTTNVATGNPSYLAVHPDSTFLYALSEVGGGRVSAYAIDRSTGALTYLNDVSSRGSGPAHVATDATGRWVFVANYGDGAIAVLPVQADGRLGEATATRNAGANAHMMVASPGNGHVYVPCKGAGYVAQYRFDPQAGTLTPLTPATVASAPGAGPRHIAFHPSGKFAYVINELNLTMTAYAVDAATGALTEIETKSTLPAGVTGGSGAAVRVHPSGKFLYGSNRGHDSIVVFALDEATGRMTLRGHTLTGGATPRDFGLDPRGTLLFAANQGAGTLVPFRIDPAQGTLTATAAPVNVATPAFVGLVNLP